MQRWIHWLEQGGGRTVLRTGAALFVLIVVSGLLLYKRQNGPAVEVVVEEAAIGRMLARGQGFSTPVNYPRTVALLEERGDWAFDPAVPLPDLFHAPGYPAVIAAALWLIPDSFEEGVIWAPPRVEGQDRKRYPPYGGDVFLTVLNIVLFDLTILFVFLLGQRAFGNTVGLLASCAVLASAGLWDAVLAVDGTSLAMLLVVLLFWALSFLKGDAAGDDEGSWARCTFVSLSAGTLAGALFLVEYTAGLLVVPAMVILAIGMSGSRRGVGLALAVLAFSVSTAPWLLRNIQLAGSPLALAGHELSLKADDPNAQPAVYRTTFSTEAPEFSTRKVLNKHLHGISRNFSERLWTGGGYLFASLFLLGILHRLRRPETGRLRWGFVAGFLLLLLLQPLFDDGQASRQPTVYLMPVAFVFGSGFLLVLVESLRRPEPLARTMILALVVVVHAIPLGYRLAEPRRQPFAYPPYFPSALDIVRVRIMPETDATRFGIVCDVPAGLSWYTGMRAWAQPRRYAEMADLRKRQVPAILLLTAETLDQPYFSKLVVPSPIEIGADDDGRTWADFYQGVATDDVPDFSRFKTQFRIWSNYYILLDPEAFRRRGGS